MTVVEEVADSQKSDNMTELKFLSGLGQKYAQDNHPAAQEILVLIAHHLYPNKLKGINGNLYWFENGAYVQCDDGQIQSLLTKLASVVSTAEGAQGFPSACTTHQMNEAIARLINLHFVDSETIDRDRNSFLAFKNGLILDSRDLTKGIITALPSNPDLIVLNKIPHDLVIPNEQTQSTTKIMQEDVIRLAEDLCPKILQSFREAVGDATIFQFEKIGLCFASGYPFPYIFVEYDASDGEGANGKTTFLRLIQRILDKPDQSKNHKTFTIQQLADTPFYVHMLRERLANLGDDIPYSIIQYTGLLKQLSGGSELEGQYKHLNRSDSFVNRAKIFFAGNRMPMIADTQNVIWERFVVTGYPNKFPRNEGYRESLLSNEKEIQGIIYVSLVAISRALLENRMTIPDQKWKESWRRNSSWVYEYVEERRESGLIKFGEDQKIPQYVLIYDMLKFRDENYRDNGRVTRKATKNSITRMLREQYHIKCDQIKQGNARDRWYFGIGFENFYWSKVMQDIEELKFQKQAEEMTG